MGKAVIFRDTIIKPVLIKMGLYSKSAEELLLGTAIQESVNFQYREQISGGPALGYFQMEPKTHDDIWDNFLKYRTNLSSNIASFMTSESADKLKELKENDKYSVAMARAHYMRVSAPLPNAGDIEAQAKYWKKYYNTPLGKGRPSEYVEKWKKHMVSVAT